MTVHGGTGSGVWFSLSMEVSSTSDPSVTWDLCFSVEMRASGRVERG